MGKTRVPAFVLKIEEKGYRAGFKSMEFYGFHKQLQCPTLYVKSKEDTSVIDDSYRARPFTGLDSCPMYPMIGAFGDYVYVTGGSALSSHVIRAMYNYEDEVHATFITPEGEVDQEKIDQLFCKRGDQTLLNSDSTRVKRFEYGQFVNLSFVENKRGEVRFGELDEDSNDSLTGWETCPSLSQTRSAGHLLQLKGKLYLIGGNLDKTSLIEVFEQDVWTTLKIQHQPDIDPHFFVSAALEDYSAILLGSKGSFYLIDVSNENGEAVCNILDRLVCEESLIHGCYKQPGFVVGKDCILWYEKSGCIRGCHFSAASYFTVDLCENILVPANIYDTPAYTAELIDLGKGKLCLIYCGEERKTSVDDDGVEYSLCDYRCVTFEIDCQVPPETEPRKSYPGVKSKPRVISRRKCYAPSDAELAAAFPMDVHLSGLGDIFNNVAGKYSGILTSFELLCFLAPAILQKLVGYAWT